MKKKTRNIIRKFRIMYIASFGWAERNFLCLSASLWILSAMLNRNICHTQRNVNNVYIAVLAIVLICAANCIFNILWKAKFLVYILASAKAWKFLWCFNNKNLKLHSNPCSVSSWAFFFKRLHGNKICFSGLFLQGIQVVKVCNSTRLEMGNVTLWRSSFEMVHVFPSSLWLSHSSKVFLLLLTPPWQAQWFDRSQLRHAVVIVMWDHKVWQMIWFSAVKTYGTEVLLWEGANQMPLV